MQTTIGNFKAKTIYNEYPRISALYYKGRGASGIKIVHSPFGNCQTFSITNYESCIKYIMYDHSKEDFKDFLKLLIKHTLRKQMTLDLRKSEYKAFINRLRRYSRQINTKSYINNNGTEMVLCVIKLDTNKLYK